MSNVTSPRLEQLLRMLEREPRDAFVLYGIGMEYKKLNALPKSLDYLAQVISVDPNYCYAYYQRGQVFEKLGDEASARQAYHDGMIAAGRAGDAHARGELEAALSMIG